MSNKNDISKTIESIINTHGTSSPMLILDELLEHYNPDLLIDILRTRVKGDNETPNSSYVIGIEVYLEKYKEDIKLKSAIARISDKYGLRENTVKTHIDNFRKNIKKKMKRLDTNGNYSPSTEDVNNLIEDVCLIVRETYSNYYMNSYPAYEPTQKDKKFKKILNDYLISEGYQYFIPF